jgi:tRNA G18 (ribose-2'-O)-methylase SpoU
LRRKIKESGLIVALDSIRDPGNLGTTLRLCDWFVMIVQKRNCRFIQPKSGAGYHGFYSELI